MLLFGSCDHKIVPEMTRNMSSGTLNPTVPYYYIYWHILSAGRAGEILYSLALASARRHGTSSFPESALLVRCTTSRRQLGLFQHHDGVTGTARDFVVVNYGDKCVTHSHCHCHPVCLLSCVMLHCLVMIDRLLKSRVSLVMIDRLLESRVSCDDWQVVRVTCVSLVMINRLLRVTCVSCDDWQVVRVTCVSLVIIDRLLSHVC